MYADGLIEIAEIAVRLNNLRSRHGMKIADEIVIVGPNPTSTEIVLVWSSGAMEYQINTREPVDGNKVRVAFRTEPTRP